MTIKKGESWGEAVVAPTELFVAPTDRAARDFVVRQRERGATPHPIGLGGGDLARTMGGGADRFPGTVTRAPIDLVRVEADEQVTWSLAHVVARRGWWSGELLFAMNAQYYGKYNVSPRAHPNDGRVDLLTVSERMGVRARRAAIRRALTGTHLPHPDLAARSTQQQIVSFARPLVIWVDGVRWTTAASLTFTVEPDALIVYA